MSNAGEIRGFFKELMQDAAEHSRTELFTYAKQRNPGANYTEGMLTGALKSLVDGNHNYICVDRGVYKLNVTVNLNNGNYARTLIEKYHQILTEAVARMENEVTASPFQLLDVGETESSQMKKIQDCMNIMKSTIEDISER